FQLWQDLLDGEPTVLQPLDGLHPAAGCLVQVHRQTAGARLACDRTRPLTQVCDGRRGQVVKAAQKAAQMVAGSGLGEGDEVPEKAVLIGRPEGTSGPARVPPVLVPGEAINEVSD